MKTLFAIILTFLFASQVMGQASGYTWTSFSNTTIETTDTVLLVSNYNVTDAHDVSYYFAPRSADSVSYVVWVDYGSNGKWTAVVADTVSSANGKGRSLRSALVELIPGAVYLRFRINALVISTATPGFYFNVMRKR